MSSIPCPQDYDVSLESAFLPSSYPLQSLPQKYYYPWEQIVNNLPALLPTKKLRSLIDQIPLLSTEYLSNEAETRRAYQCLGFLAHAYIWGGSQPVDKLPENIAKPLLEVSEELRLPPLATYATLCLWNFRPIFPDKEFSLDNLTTINTFTGSIDESWFYLVSVIFEYKGGACIDIGLKTMHLIEQGAQSSVITRHLQELAEQIDYLGSILKSMEENCDPHVFYYRIRPFLAGWKGMSDVGLNKDGVIYGNETSPRSYAGGSNAQSSLIQFLDILLSVEHFATGERPGADDSMNSKHSAFMNDMRNYMPGKHRDFLEALKENCNIRDYVMANEEDGPLILSYDACLAMLKAFRDKHIQIVTRYIVLQAKKQPKLGSTSTIRSGLAKKSVADKGTGGTSLLPFLKQCRDETGDPAAGSWGKRILTDGAMRLKYSKPNGINEE